ncbi:MAG: hypothetical protein GEV08_02660 [Acidimicrobiia bacterium]|nr:hypothetical protein [Acidimicrobiia bacterium]
MRPRPWPWCTPPARGRARDRPLPGPRPHRVEVDERPRRCLRGDGGSRHPSRRRADGKGVQHRLLLLGLALVAVALTACGDASGRLADKSAAGPTSGLDALEVLSDLAIEAQHLAAPAYGRDQWPHWLDADGDGCDTRDEVLLDEAAVVPAAGAGCTLDGGRWVSAFDHRHTADAVALDVDHLVSLAEAHRSGGWAWDEEEKAAYANDLDDPRTLVAVAASSNRAKGDRDPAGWLPEEGVCRYAADWVAVKARWGLSVDAEEATTLSDLLVDPCAGTTVAPWPPPSTGDGGAAPPSTSGVPVPLVPAGADPFPNCSAARAVGAAPLHQGEPGYGAHLDGDGDGTACE